MLLLKIYYHIFCYLKLMFYKLLYGTAIDIAPDVHFRKGFHLVVEGQGG